MDAALTFILLLRCCCVWSLPRGRSVSFSMVFSGGTQLLVDDGDGAADCDEDDLHHDQNKTTGTGSLVDEQMRCSAPSVQILSSIPLSQDPASPRLLVCLLTGLKSPLQDVLWWADDMVVTSSDAAVSWTKSEEGGAYSTTSVWEVSAADWRSRSRFWCGTIKGGGFSDRKSARGTDCDSEVETGHEQLEVCRWTN